MKKSASLLLLLLAILTVPSFLTSCKEERRIDQRPLKGVVNIQGMSVPITIDFGHSYVDKTLKIEWEYPVNVQENGNSIKFKVDGFIIGKYERDGNNFNITFTDKHISGLSASEVFYNGEPLSNMLTPGIVSDKNKEINGWVSGLEEEMQPRCEAITNFFFGDGKAKWTDISTDEDEKFDNYVLLINGVKIKLK